MFISQKTIDILVNTITGTIKNQFIEADQTW